MAGPRRTGKLSGGGRKGAGSDGRNESRCVILGERTEGRPTVPVAVREKVRAVSAEVGGQAALYRVVPALPGTAAAEAGGPLYAPRHRQGSGRHDNPEHYGALYASRSPESAVAERLQNFRGQVIVDRDLRFPDGRQYALTTVDDDGLGPLTDLDDPAELVRRDLRPSSVATHRRALTRRTALRI